MAGVEETGNECNILVGDSHAKRWNRRRRRTSENV